MWNIIISGFLHIVLHIVRLSVSGDILDSEERYNCIVNDSQYCRLKTKNDVWNVFTANFQPRNNCDSRLVISDNIFQQKRLNNK